MVKRGKKNSEQKIRKLEMEEMHSGVFYTVSLPNGEKQVFIKHPEFLTTRYPFDSKMPLFFNEISEKDLFELDFDLIEEYCPQSAPVIYHFDIDRIPKEPLILFAVTQKDVPERHLSEDEDLCVYLEVTNAKKVKKMFQERANVAHSSNETVFIVFPFQFIQSKYIRVDWESDCGFTLVFNDLSKESIDELNDFELFVCFFRRLLKFVCDADLIRISIS